MKQNGIIALVNCDETVIKTAAECHFEQAALMLFKNGLDLSTQWNKQALNITAIITQGEILSPTGIALREALNQKKMPVVPFIIICNNITDNLRSLALQAGVTEIFMYPVSTDQLQTKVTFLLEHWNAISSSQKNNARTPYKIPFDKRVFDLLFASIALLLLSPLFLIIAIWIRLESKGPIFYYSLRVGTGYKVFKFHKFRSMYVNADKRLKDLKHLNQYNIDNPQPDITPTTMQLCDDCIKAGTKCQYPLYADENVWCEKASSKRAAASGSAFIKIKDDPRITKVGKFIRNSSIDELPQLWNVIKGDMSIVGNRPLPLYEAEKLTTDKYALRFHAPAGITGLWQVEKRGKGEMSEEERLMLDNTYAKNHSLAGDIKLILKTIPALLQKENV
jgi:lipopolysaccharide/colanic/teichoic acid biosynthesis glycosyltransferase